MNSKKVKKIRQIIRKEQIGGFTEFADAINKSPLRLRLRIALKVIKGTL